MRRSWSLALVLLPRRRRLRRRRTPEAAASPPPPRAARHRRSPAADLKARISIFADDSMLGRRAGTPGNVRGNAYIAAELARLGLTARRRRRRATCSGCRSMSYALDSRRATLHAGARLAGALRGLLSRTSRPSPCPPARSTGAPGGVHRQPGRLGSLPSARSAQGQGGRSSASSAAGNSLGAPDLGPQGPLGLIAGIVVTEIDPLLVAVRRTTCAAPQARGQGGDLRAARGDPAADALPPDRVGREAVRQAARRAQAGRHRPGAPGRGRRTPGRSCPPPTWWRCWKAPTRRFADSTWRSARTTMPSASCRRWSTTACAPTTR